jgi:hypothetical protein
LIGKSANCANLRESRQLPPTTTLSIAELPKEAVRCTCIRRSRGSYVTQSFTTIFWCCSKSVLAQNFTALIRKVHSPGCCTNHDPRKSGKMRAICCPFALSPPSSCITPFQRVVPILFLPKGWTQTLPSRADCIPLLQIGNTKLLATTTTIDLSNRHAREFYCRARTPSLTPFLMSDAQRAGAFLKKRKDVWLPFQTNSEKVVRSRVTRGRFATPASTRPQTLSGQPHSEEDEDEDDVDKLIRPQPAARQQLLTDSFAQSTSSTSLVLTRGGRQSTERHPQERVELNRSTNSPWTPLALGGNDPFSILPSDLPRKFIDERMHISK